MFGIRLIKNNELSVDLDLFSAQYPPTTAINSYYVPKPLNSTHFIIPLDSKIKSSIEACLKNQGFDTQTVRTEKLIATLIEHYNDCKIIKFYYIILSP